MAVQLGLLVKVAVCAVLCLASKCEEAAKDSPQCANARTARAESYLETATIILDKLKENLPENGAPDCSCPPQPMDCEEVSQCGHNRSGVFEVFPRNRVLFGGVSVFCDLEQQGGGWTVIQRRGEFRRPVDFFRKPWHDYKTGFGDLRRDFWIGNDVLYALTNQKRYYLRIEMEDFDNNTRYAFYDQFWVDNEAMNYKLHVYDYSGDAGDSLSRHDGHDFSTLDRDNDNSTDHCALDLQSGWWFSSCASANLNGLYHGPDKRSEDGVLWTSWKGLDSLRKAEMKVRPVDFKLDLLDMDIEAV